MVGAADGLALRAAGQADEKGKLADNIVYFARVLRGAGVRVGTAAAVEAVRAVQAGGISTRDDFYWTLHCVLINRAEDRAVFDEAFRLFWRSRGLVEKMLQMFSPMAVMPEREKRAGQARVAQSLSAGRKADEPGRSRVEIDARLTTSQREVLRRKDFAQMTADELAQAKRAMANLNMPDDWMRLRRFERVGRPANIDKRRTVSASLRTGGDLILPKFRQHRQVRPPIVVLADISGSMGQYSRVFLHFLHALCQNRRRVHTFLFGTRLTNVTRQLRAKDPDIAVEQCCARVEDWSGGTRISASLHEFNRNWSRRLLGQGAIVLLITDGLERDDGEEALAHEMDRLHRSCARLIWLNPLLRFAGFEVRARGIKAMLPHVDEFLPAHSLAAIEDLAGALSQARSGATDPRAWLRAAA